jgi:hypothetical protein
MDRNYTSERFKESAILRGKNRGRQVTVEIMAGVGASVDSGDLCRDCLYSFLDMHDHRPRASAVGGDSVVASEGSLQHETAR